MVLLIVATIFVIIQNHRNRLRHKKEFFTEEIALREKIRSHIKDGMEIKPCNVALYEEIGEGAFGIVRKGVLKSTNQSIAVKMLKGSKN